MSHPWLSRRDGNQFKSFIHSFFSRAFLASGSEGGVEISTAIAPELAGDVFASFKEAEAKTQVEPSPC